MLTKIIRSDNLDFLEKYLIENTITTRNLMRLLINLSNNN